MIQPGQFYRDLDSRCDGRTLEIVYVVRAPQETRVVCPLGEVRRHELCHVDAHEMGIKDECHDGRKF